MAIDMTVARLLVVGLMAGSLMACGGGGDGDDSDDEPPTHSLGGTANGLVGELALLNNGGDRSVISGSGTFTAFTFDAALAADGFAYNIAIESQPDGLDCTVNNGSGTATADVSTIAIDCELTIAPTLSYDIKTFRFTWPAVAGATHYRLLENPDGESGFSDVSGDINATTYDHTNLPLWERVNASYILQACDETGCNADTEAVYPSANPVDAIGYFRASNPGRNDLLGWGLALSEDGSTLAVSAASESSSPSEGQDDDSLDASGAVYIFTRVNGQWQQHAFIKAPNAGLADFFGTQLTLSADGNTLAVSAIWEDNNATGIHQNVDEDNDDSPDSGAVYVFARNGDNWPLQAYIKAPSAGEDDSFGSSVVLSGDGLTLAVAATNEDGVDDSGPENAGAIYIYERTESSWSHSASLKALEPGIDDSLGSYPIFSRMTLSLSYDGAILAAGTPHEDSASTGIHTNQIPTDNDAPESGAVYIFSQSNDGTWAQQALLKTSNTDGSDFFGTTVSLSGDGNVLAVGARGEDADPLFGEDDNSFENSGAVYVFAHNGDTWIQDAYLKASNAGPEDEFSSVSLNFDGTKLAVGALGESSDAAGFNGSEDNNESNKSGAAYLFAKLGESWVQQAYLKAPTPLDSETFGSPLVISADGNTLAVGGLGDSSSAQGVNGEDSEDSVFEFRDSGAVYLY